MGIAPFCFSRAVLRGRPFSDGFSHIAGVLPMPPTPAYCGGKNKQVLEKFKISGYPPHKKWIKRRQFFLVFFAKNHGAETL